MAEHHLVMDREATVVVIGGGVTGVGVARDLAMRGIDVTLVERDRLAAGTTGRNHGLLHSGARYAVSDPTSAKQCRRENGILRKIAAHCIEDTGGLFVQLENEDSTYFDRKREACREAGIPIETVDGETARRMEPALSETIERALLVPDAAIDPFRLVAANAESAAKNGATFLTGRTVVDLKLDDESVVGVVVETEAGSRETIETAYVVNAAGPWVAEISSQADLEIPVAPSKGAMVVTNSRPVDTVINRCRPKGEGDILVPHETTAILGTTDRSVAGPESYEEDPAEIEFLVDELSAVVPDLQHARLIRTYWGVRPLYDAGSADSSVDTARDFVVLDHERRDDLPGLITVLGGKLTTYRLMAETVADTVTEALGVDAPCRTAEKPLPGSEDDVDFTAIMQEYALRSPIADRTTDRLGTQSEAVLESSGPNPVVCECEGVTAAEIRAAIEAAGPDLGAVRQRTRATMGTCQGGMCSHRLAVLLAESHDNETVWRELQNQVEERWRGQRFVLAGDHLSQAALNHAVRQLSVPIPTGSKSGKSISFDRFDNGMEAME